MKLSPLTLPQSPASPSLISLTAPLAKTLALSALVCSASILAAPIDRHALVSRHDVSWPTVDGVMPLGNGEFCFNADGTGLQTFGGNTMAHWAWHSFPMPPGTSSNDVPRTGTFQKGRPTGGDTVPPEMQAVRGWMLDNPHSFNLGRLRLQWSDGREISLSEIGGLDTRLTLWSGGQFSRFNLDGVPVVVRTCVHPKLDAVSIRVESPLLASNRLSLVLDFPYPSSKRAAWMGSFTQDSAHRTTRLRGSNNGAEFEREIDATKYFATMAWSAGGSCHTNSQTPHRLILSIRDTGRFDLTLAYSREPLRSKLPLFEQTQRLTSAHWQDYWDSGGALDLSGSKDPRWHELERRVVLSQYHMAAQSAGSFPSAEAGLMLVDNWGSRFHMEMVWWHLAHYGLWNRWPLAERALEVYDRFLPGSLLRAQQLGLEGACWPKGVGPDGISKPWIGNVALLWREPHPIFFAELEYRLHPTHATLKKWAPLIQATTDYMADYAQSDGGTYNLAPDMPPGELGLTTNSVFDLAYWRWGLAQAQRWRERMHQPRVARWDEVRRQLAPLPVKDGLYVHSTVWLDTFTNPLRHRDHPDPVGVFGMLPPTEGVDVETAHRTVLEISRMWSWQRTWGWDYPWMAMAAARTGEPKLAVDCLLMDVPKNAYDWRGVNEGGPCPYLPGNGGLLYAIAMMAAGWDGAPTRPAPGFPHDDSWNVKWEGLRPAP